MDKYQLFDLNLLICGVCKSLFVYITAVYFAMA